MVYKVVWTPKAIESYVANMHYLERAWTEKEVKSFAALVKRKYNFYPASQKLELPEAKNNRISGIRYFTKEYY